MTVVLPKVNPFKDYKAPHANRGTLPVKHYKNKHKKLFKGHRP